MGFMVLDPNNDRGHQIDVIPEKGQEYQAVRIFGKDIRCSAYSGHPSKSLRYLPLNGRNIPDLPFIRRLANDKVAAIAASPVKKKGGPKAAL